MAEGIKSPDEKPAVKLKKGPYTWTGLEADGEVNERTTSEDFLSPEEKVAQEVAEELTSQVFGDKKTRYKSLKEIKELTKSKTVDSEKGPAMADLSSSEEEWKGLDEVLKENIKKTASAAPEIKKEAPPAAVPEPAPAAPEIVNPTPPEPGAKITEAPAKKTFEKIIPPEEVVKSKTEELLKREPFKIIPAVEAQGEPGKKEPVKIIPAAEIAIAETKRPGEYTKIIPAAGISKNNELIGSKEKWFQKVQEDREAKETQNLRDKEKWHQEVEGAQKPSAEEDEGEIYICIPTSDPNLRGVLSFWYDSKSE